MDTFDRAALKFLRVARRHPPTMAQLAGLTEALHECLDPTDQQRIDDLVEQVYDRMGGAA